MQQDNDKKGIRISRESFIISTAFIFAMMVATYILTIVFSGGIPLWKWVLSPILVLTAKGSATLIAVILFLLLIGGVFNVLTEQGIIAHMLQKLVRRFGAVRYRLMAVLILFFMMMGAFVGSFEEVIPLVPIVVSLAVGLGWDVYTGMGMSLLAVGCGFASGVSNPFTIGVAQTLAGLPMFSGMGYRFFNFVCIYILLLVFVNLHARKIAKDYPERDNDAYIKDAKMDKGVIFFAVIMVLGIASVVAAAFVPALSDYTMIILAAAFLAAGVLSALVSGMPAGKLIHSFGAGVAAIAPSIIMILMASSIRYVMDESGVLNILLGYSMDAAAGMPKWAVILFIYLICLAVNFFVPSGSAEAILLIPLIVPLAQAFGIGAQLCIVAFAFGDGFSNVFYPTNPCLLIALGLTDTSYQSWVKYSLPFQLLNLVLTAGLLVLGLYTGWA